jgi:hypothetical protein
MEEKEGGRTGSPGEPCVRIALLHDPRANLPVFIDRLAQETWSRLGKPYLTG